jgi:threonine/homoserine/homoserine lactone efflux protein
MGLDSWLQICAVCAMGAMSPGPSLAVVVRNTVAGGRPRGAATGLGHGVGVGIYAFGAVAGVSALVGSVPGLHRAIEIAGGLYLAWIGCQTLRNAGRASQDERGVAGRRGFTEGFLMALLNPKVAVFFLALLGSFLPPAATLAERTGVAGLAMVIDAGWYVFAAIVLAGTGAAAWLGRNGAWVDRGLGVLLLAVAAALLLRQPAQRTCTNPVDSNPSRMNLPTSFTHTKETCPPSNQWIRGQPQCRQRSSA